MVSLLGSPNEDKKGLLVFTHKEAQALSYRYTLTRAFPFFRLNRLVVAAIAKLVYSVISRDHLSGVHIGWKVPDSHPAYWDRWDFLLGTPRLVSEEHNGKLIPLVSAFFTPDSFGKPPRRNRYWDLTHIHSVASYKNWPHFLDVARDVLEGNKDARVLSICVSSGIRSSEQRKFEIQSLARQIMGNHFGDRFTHLEVVGQRGNRGFDLRFIEYLLGDSKVFAMFSNLEGTPKIVTEAIAAGCWPFVTESLTKNSAFLPWLGPSHHFIPGQEAQQILQKAYDWSTDFGLEGTSRHPLRESDAKRELIRQLLLLFGDTFISDNLDNLSHRLPAHTRKSSPWIPVRRRGTSDLKTALDWIRFLREVKRRDTQGPGARFGDILN